MMCLKDINVGILFSLMMENKTKLQTLIAVWTIIFSRMITCGTLKEKCTRFYMAQTCQGTKIIFLFLIVLHLFLSFALESIMGKKQCKLFNCPLYIDVKILNHERLISSCSLRQHMY